MTETTIRSINEPTILTANTYFWTPNSHASGRRSNEKRNRQAVAAYFEAIGLTVTMSGDMVKGVGKGISAIFNYSESCHHVYKSLSVYRDGVKSNIKAIRKIAANID